VGKRPVAGAGDVAGLRRVGDAQDGGAVGVQGGGEAEQGPGEVLEGGGRVEGRRGEPVLVEGGRRPVVHAGGVGEGADEVEHPGLAGVVGGGDAGVWEGAEPGWGRRAGDGGGEGREVEAVGAGGGRREVVRGGWVVRVMRRGVSAAEEGGWRRCLWEVEWSGLFFESNAVDLSAVWVDLSAVWMEERRRNWQSRDTVVHTCAWYGLFHEATIHPHVTTLLTPWVLRYGRAGHYGQGTTK